MSITMRWLTCAGLALAGLAPGAARAATEVNANLRPGLWQFTTQVDSHGQMPIPDETLQRLTPAQRAQLDAMMKQSAAGSGAPIVRRSCVTAEDIRRNEMVPDEGANCTHSVVRGSATHWDIHQQCSAENGESRDETFHFDAPSSTRMHGDGTILVSQAGKSMQIHSTTSGNWLGASCGDLRPGESKPVR